MQDCAGRTSESNGSLTSVTQRHRPYAFERSRGSVPRGRAAELNEPTNHLQTRDMNRNPAAQTPQIEFFLQ